eukprot:gene12099-biopygen1334
MRALEGRGGGQESLRRPNCAGVPPAKESMGDSGGTCKPEVVKAATIAAAAFKGRTGEDCTCPVRTETIPQLQHWKSTSCLQRSAFRVEIRVGWGEVVAACMEARPQPSVGAKMGARSYGGLSAVLSVVGEIRTGVIDCGIKGGA